MEGGVYVSCSMKKYTSYFRMVYVVFTMDCCAYNINEISMELPTVYVSSLDRSTFFLENSDGTMCYRFVSGHIFFLEGSIYMYACSMENVMYIMFVRLVDAS